MKSTAHCPIRSAPTDPGLRYTPDSNLINIETVKAIILTELAANFRQASDPDDKYRNNIVELKDVAHRLKHQVAKKPSELPSDEERQLFRAQAVNFIGERTDLDLVRYGMCLASLIEATDFKTIRVLVSSLSEALVLDQRSAFRATVNARFASVSAQRTQAFELIRAGLIDDRATFGSGAD